MINWIKTRWGAYRLGRHIQKNIKLFPDFYFSEGNRILLRKQKSNYGGIEYVEQQYIHCIDFMPDENTHKYMAILD